MFFFNVRFAIKALFLLLEDWLKLFKLIILFLGLSRPLIVSGCTWRDVSKIRSSRGKRVRSFFSYLYLFLFCFNYIWRFTALFVIRWIFVEIGMVESCYRYWINCLGNMEFKLNFYLSNLAILLVRVCICVCLRVCVCLFEYLFVYFVTCDYTFVSSSEISSKLNKNNNYLCFFFIFICLFIYFSICLFLFMWKKRIRKRIRGRKEWVWNLK